MTERTVFKSMSQRHVISLGPHASIWDAACLERGFRHLPIVSSGGKILGGSR